MLYGVQEHQSNYESDRSCPDIEMISNLWEVILDAPAEEASGLVNEDVTFGGGRGLSISIPGQAV